MVVGKLTLFFNRDTSHTDITITVQGADALTGWTDLARSTAGTAFVPLLAAVTVSESGTGMLRTMQIGDAFTTTDPAHPRRFLRIHVLH